MNFKEERDLFDGYMLSETFLKKEDPTIVVGKFIREASRCLSGVQKAYNDNAANRMNIVNPVLNDIQKLKIAIAEAEKTLRMHASGKIEPEDENLP